MNNIKVKCEVIQDFFLEAFREITIIKRKSIDVKGKLFVGDIIECSKEMADYLSGNNDYEEKVVKIIEVEPEKETTEELKKRLRTFDVIPIEHLVPNKQIKSKNKTSKK